MASHVVRHPGFSLIALVVAMLVGSISVSSTVEVGLVGTSWLGLDFAAGVGLSVACSILSLVVVACLVFAALSANDGEDDDDGRGRDDEPPSPEGPSGEPTWWPQFEREFASYTHGPEPGRRRSETPSTMASNSTR
jgi:hypothetical protein